MCSCLVIPRYIWFPSTETCKFGREGVKGLTIVEARGGKRTRTGDFGYVEAAMQVVKRIKLDAMGDRPAAVSSTGPGSEVNGKGDKR